MTFHIWKRFGRTSPPYSFARIHKLPCYRCGQPSAQQWKICSDGKWRTLCRDCDIMLNKIVLEFMGHPDASAVLSRYIARMK